MKNIFFFLTVGMFLFLSILFVSAADTDYSSIIQEATTQGDVKVCDKIDIPTGKDACVLGVALATGDIKLCDTMSDVSKMAYQDKICGASVTFDTKYCDEIDLPAIKTNCYNIVEENKKRGNIPPAQKPPVQQQPKETKPGCKTDDECRDNICSNGKCIEPKVIFIFVPVNWESSMEEFDKKVDERVNLFLNAVPLKDCNEKPIKVIKSHENCDVSFSTKFLYWKDILRVKGCSLRVTTNYDLLVGLTDSVDTLYDGKVRGISMLGYDTVIATAKDTFVVSHEVGHTLGLRDEYCNDNSILSLGTIRRRCGFGVQPNPLKSEYGCREKDGNSDGFPDCCWSDKYEAGCKGNVGLSESELAEKIYDSRTYDAMDGIFENNNFVLDNAMKCKTDAAVKEKLKTSAELLEKNISEFNDIQAGIGFKTYYGFSEDLKKLYEITKCPKEADFCDCLTGGRTTNTMGILSAIKTISLKPSEVILFDKYNIMATEEGGKGSPTEFSKPAYDYLSTLPEMQCPSDTGETPISSSDALSLCEKISDATTKNDCIAIVTNNAKKCGKPDTCNSFFAIKNKDVSLCESTSDKSSCEAYSRRDIKLCDKARYPRECQIIVASLNNNPSQCMMDKEEDTNYCKALVNEDIDLCDNAPDDKKDFCALLMALSQKSENGCEKARSLCVTAGHKDCNNLETSCKSAVKGKIIEDIVDKKISCDKSEACAATLILDTTINGVSDSSFELLAKNNTKGMDYFIITAVMNKANFPMKEFVKGSIMTIN